MSFVQHVILNVKVVHKHITIVMNALLTEIKTLLFVVVLMEHTVMILIKIQFVKVNKISYTIYYKNKIKIFYKKYY